MYRTACENENQIKPLSECADSGAHTLLSHNRCSSEHLGYESCIRPIRQEPASKPAVFAPAGWITALWSVGSYIIRKQSVFFLPLVPITMTSQRSTSVFPDSLHFTFPWSPLDNGAKVAFSSNVGLTDTEYTLLSFACSLDEFFLENKIMKTIRPLNTEKKICVTLFPYNPFHFIKAGPCFPPVEDSSQVESCPLQA